MFPNNPYNFILININIMKETLKQDQVKKINKKETVDRLVNFLHNNQFEKGTFCKNTRSQSNIQNKQTKNKNKESFLILRNDGRKEAKYKTVLKYQQNPLVKGHYEHRLGPRDALPHLYIRPQFTQTNSVSPDSFNQLKKRKDLSCLIISLKLRNSEKMLSSKLKKTIQQKNYKIPKQLISERKPKKPIQLFSNETKYHQKQRQKWNQIKFNRWQANDGHDLNTHGYQVRFDTLKF